MMLAHYAAATRSSSRRVPPRRVRIAPEPEML